MKITRLTRRRLAAQQQRVKRILARVRDCNILAATDPDELIVEVQRNAERMAREGGLRADQLRDLRAFHTTILADKARQKVTRP